MGGKQNDGCYSTLSSRNIPSTNSNLTGIDSIEHNFKHLLTEELGCARPDSACSSSPPRSVQENFTSDRNDEYWPVDQHEQVRAPRLIHTWHCEHSILSLSSTKKWIIAGSGNGDILVFNKETFEIEFVLKGHAGSVYSLALTEDERFLFSGSADSLVKVWDLETMEDVWTIYSVYDIGDVFTVAWAPSHEYLFLGAQNASIQWIRLYEKESYNTTKDPSGLPSIRYDRFFDSKGPGGCITPQQSATAKPKKFSGTSALLEIPPKSVIPFAHFSYVYSLLVIKRKVTHGSTSYEEELLISGGGDGTAKIWNFNSDSTIEQLYILDTESPVFSMCCQDSFLYCGLSAGQVCIIDLDTRQIIRNDKLGDDEVMTMSLYRDCLFRGGNRYVRKWDSKRYHRGEWLAHNGLVLATVLAVSNGRTLLVTGGNDSVVSMWDITPTLKHSVSSKDCALLESSFNATNSIMFFNQNKDNNYGSEKNQINNVIDKQVTVAPLTLDHMIETLRSFVSYKTVSGHDDKYLNDCRRCATFLKSVFKHFGADSQLLPLKNGGNPIVYARFSGTNNSDSSKKSSRILFYGHYDVIYAEKSGQWATDPFEMTNMDGYMYGRGVSDNKGPILAAIFAVAELVQRSELTNDIVFLIEGEEECGSVGFQEAVNRHKDLIGDIAWVLLSNSYWLDDSTPCLNYGLRGIIKASVEIKGDLPDLHSGVHGGVYREPTFDLVNLLSKLATDQGEIVLPEFHNSVRPVGDQERALYEAIVNRPKQEASTFENKPPQKTQHLTEQINCGCDSNDEDKNADIETLMGRWRYPSLTIHKIQVSGPGNSTLIPQSATASLSLRIVPDQDLEVIKTSLKSFLHTQFAGFKSDNHLTVSIYHEAEPWVGDPGNRAFELLRTVISQEWGTEPLFIREGGSIPAVRFLEKAFGAPAAQLPCGQASDGAHLDNERLRVLNFSKAKEIFLKTFRDLV